LLEDLCRRTGFGEVCLVLRGFLGRRFALPSIGKPPVQDRPEGASCPIGPRFSSLKIALGGFPHSAAKCPVIPGTPLQSLPAGAGVLGRRRRGGWRLFWSDSKCRVIRRHRANRAGSPIKAAQHRMCCKAGPSVPADCEGSPAGTIEPEHQNRRHPPRPTTPHSRCKPDILLGLGHE
jgi:hypothetical protein